MTRRPGMFPSWRQAATRCGLALGLSLLGVAIVFAVVEGLS